MSNQVIGNTKLAGIVIYLLKLPPISPTATPQGQRRRSDVMAIKSIVKHVVGLQAALIVSRRRRTSRYVATTRLQPFGKSKKLATPHGHLFQRGSMWLVKTKRIVGSFGYVIAKHS